MEYYKKEVKDILEELNVDRKNGLDNSEVKKRQEKFGLNELIEGKKETVFAKFINQFKDVMIIILIIAGIISGYVGIKDNEGIFSTLVIFLVVILNAVIGVMQELKAEKSLEALKKLTTHTVKTIRNGEIFNIDSKEIVKGDICIFEAGDVIPADCRIIEANNIKTEEASLTGESHATFKQVEKIEKNNLPLGDMKNMLFSSSLVISGSAVGVVVETGMNTEVGKIANMLTTDSRKITPLEEKLNNLGKILGISCIIIAVIIFIVGILYGKSIISMLMISISLAVAAIPEGLPAIATIILAIGTTRLAKQKAIVKKLASVESLGSASVICSDKTGTLTKNEMTVEKVFVDNQIMLFSDILKKKNSSKKESNIEKLLMAGSLSSSASINSEGEYVGDPTEIALILANREYNLQKRIADFVKIKEIPFTSERKMMSVIYRKDNENYIFVKGGIDEVLKISKISDEEKNKYLSVAEELSNKAYRVLACGYRKLDSCEMDNSCTYKVSFEENIIPIGLFALIDPPREEVKKSIEECRSAGIKTIMITGDHKNTAKAIGEKLGIYSKGDNVISGSELEEISDKELSEKIENTTIFARVNPEHKVRIVDILKNKKEIVAMTGDGVNDAPALKKADIGCAMGITGTEVSKESADLIITDDNFASIVSAVKEGRNIYKNILKAVEFLLSANIGEIVIIFLSIIFIDFFMLRFNIDRSFINKIIPLLPVQLLWINLVTDTFPALALGMDPCSSDIMKEKPNKEKRVFTKNRAIKIVLQGIMIGIIALIAYMYGLSREADSLTKIKAGSTMAFFTLAFSELAFVFGIRNEKETIFAKELFNNKYLIYGIGVSTLLMLITTVPFISEVFGIIRLNTKEIILCIILSLTPLFILECVKMVKRNIFKRG